jgi:hypothetical protein
MYLDRAEDLIEFWADEGGHAPSAPRTAHGVAREFGGRVSHG